MLDLSKGNNGVCVTATQDHHPGALPVEIDPVDREIRELR